MKERPILFSAPMVRAILNGTKTQTRRVAKLTANGHVKEPGGNRRWHTADFDARLACPYGQPGDRLWVRETWGFEKRTEDDKQLEPVVTYRADDVEHLYPVNRWRPSIHMPRHLSRITLEITGVRLERLQDISNEDCIAEGIAIHPNESAPRIGQAIDEPARRHGLISHYGAEYARLWKSINGPGSWDANPLVWVVEFKRLEGGAA